jgi:hypothetical protein
MLGVMLPPPRSELVPLVIPDALLDPALLNGFAGNCVSVGPNGYTVFQGGGLAGRPYHHQRPNIMEPEGLACLILGVFVDAGGTIARR